MEKLSEGLLDFMKTAVEYFGNTELRTDAHFAANVAAQFSG